MNDHGRNDLVLTLSEVIMLRVTVGKSRKLSQDYNSTGFSVTVDGEITAPLDSPEQILTQVQILHDIASESLQDQVDRLKDPDDKVRLLPERRDLTSSPQSSNSTNRSPSRWQNQNGSSQTSVSSATDKQVQYLLNLGKNKGLSKVDLETHVAERLNFDAVKSVYELSKSEATSAIDLVKA